MSNNWNLSIPEEIYDKYGQDVALPSFYERACVAVKECVDIPEANEWKGKAEAIIAYSKTVDDKRLENYAKRIKARAYRRMGELLKSYKGNNNQHTPLTVTSVAEQNGITERKQRTAINLADVPDQQFTEQIDRGNPATITDLAKQGIEARKEEKRKEGKTSFLYSEKPKGFNEAMYIKGDLRRLTEKFEEYDPLFIMGGLDAKGIEDVKNYISIIEAWCDTFIINID